MPRCLETFHFTELCPPVTGSLKLLLCFRLRYLPKYCLTKLQSFRLLEKNQLRTEIGPVERTSILFGRSLVSQVFLSDV